MNAVFIYTRISGVFKTFKTVGAFRIFRPFNVPQKMLTTD